MTSAMPARRSQAMGLSATAAAKNQKTYGTETRVR
jgi:hypothetical protein